MKRRLAKLLDVKSIVTLSMTAIFLILSCKGKILAEDFMEIFEIIMVFYFGTQVGKTSAGSMTDEKTEQNNK